MLQYCHDVEIAGHFEVTKSLARYIINTIGKVCKRTLELILRVAKNLQKEEFTNEKERTDEVAQEWHNNGQYCD